MCLGRAEVVPAARLVPARAREEARDLDDAGVLLVGRQEVRATGQEPRAVGFEDLRRRARVGVTSQIREMSASGWSSWMTTSPLPFTVTLSKLPAVMPSLPVRLLESTTSSIDPPVGCVTESNLSR